MQEQQVQNQSTSGQPPVWSKRLGYAQVAIWARTHESGKVFHSITPTIRYKNKEGNYADTTTSSVQELGNVIKLLQKAQDWLIDNDKN